MQAIQVQQVGGPDVLKLTNLPIPSAVGDNEILVKNVFAGLNFIDTNVRKGAMPAPLPLIPGMEASGTVEKAGSAVANTFPVGSKVAYMGIGVKAYAGFAVVDASKAVTVPEGVSFEDAAGCMMQGLTAQYLVSEDGVYNIKRGDNVLIQAGAGGMGQLLTQIASKRGANVVTTVSTAEKAKISKASGAHAVVRYADDAGNAVDWTKEAIAASTGGKGFDVVYDSVGKATWSGSFEVLKKRGYFVLYGTASGAPDPISPPSLGPKSLFLTRPMLFHYIEKPGELQSRAAEVFRWLADGTIKFSYTKLPLAKAAEAHEALEARKTTGKILFEISQA